MKKIYHSYPAFIFLLIFISQNGFCQTGDMGAKYKKMAAGPEYKRSSFYQFLWGRNYRKEWTTPVNFPVTNLDTLKGGIKSYKEGGSHQSTGLHVKTTDGKEYALRSVDKSLSKLVPEIFQHTFIEHIANDEISMSNPYGALAVPLMAKAAGIPHTYPQYLYVPKQPALDSFNKKYGDRLYLFEQRPSGDWNDADNLGNFKKFISSDEMLDKIYEDNDREADQQAFVKYRLFDMLIGDWDRHLDQWKWGSTDADKEKIYEPIPTDRDQAFFKYNGFLLKTVVSASGMKYLQSFDYKIENVTELYSERRIMDRFLTNKVTLNQWQTIAKNLQQAITDNVIEASVKQLPPEIFAISGNKIIAQLKSRRDHLAEYAEQYYLFLAKEVEIVGSKQSEYFEVNRLNDNETSINLYKLNKEGKIKHNDPFYSRVFNTNETKEIRLYGLSGNDVFKIDGRVNNGIRIRIIGGNERDSIIDNSNIKTFVYDDADNVFVKGSRTKLHISKDTAIHNFYYDTYNPNKKGIKPLIFYNNEDRFYVGIGYGIVHNKWRKIPFASKNEFAVHYSISQKAFSVLYNGLFPNLFGKWDLLLHADYDAIHWTNFYGTGNNTLYTDDVDYFRMQTEETLASAGIQKRSGGSTFNISGFYQSVRIINNPDRFIAKSIAPTQPDVYNFNNYAGAALNYKYVNTNDSVVPTKGVSFFANASYTQNLKQSNQTFGNYSGIANFYIPLFSKFSLLIRGTGATVSGNPMFYDLPRIGGADDLRGYRRERFFGRSAVTNSNELRFITNFRTHILNGKIGLVAFYDEGRVWMPNETSNQLHTDYGGGILLAPFNKLLANIAYGISNEAKLIQLRIIKSF